MVRSDRSAEAATVRLMPPMRFQVAHWGAAPPDISVGDFIRTAPFSICSVLRPVTAASPHHHRPAVKQRRAGASLVQREVGSKTPEGLCFSVFSFSTSLVRRRWRAFSVTFDCPKVTKGHRGHFKPSPGPPGEGAGGMWCAFPKVRRPRPEAPLTRNGFGSLTQFVCARKL